MANFNSQRKRTGNIPITTLEPTELQRRIVALRGGALALHEEFIFEAGFKRS